MPKDDKSCQKLPKVAKKWQKKAKESERCQMTPKDRGCHCLTDVTGKQQPRTAGWGNTENNYKKLNIREEN